MRAAAAAYSFAEPDWALPAIPQAFEIAQMELALTATDSGRIPRARFNGKKSPTRFAQIG